MVRLDVRSLLQDAAIEEVNFFSLEKKSENYTSLLLIKINQHVLVVFFFRLKWKISTLMTSPRNPREKRKKRVIW